MEAVAACGHRRQTPMQTWLDLRDDAMVAVEPWSVCTAVTPDRMAMSDANSAVKRCSASWFVGILAIQPRHPSSILRLPGVSMPASRLSHDSIRICLRPRPLGDAVH
jgi:hypothetical protein